MEEILDLYQRPLDPNRPLVCMDEQPVQLVKEIRQPLPMKPGKQKSPSRVRKLDGAQEALLIAQSCSQPPEGKSRWTLHMLADRMVELNIVDSISHQTVSNILKKTN